MATAVCLRPNLIGGQTGLETRGPISGRINGKRVATIRQRKCRRKRLEAALSSNGPTSTDAVDDLDALARDLQSSGQFQVLKKLRHRPVNVNPRPGFPFKGAIVDTETTGLDHDIDEVIEIAVITFTYDHAGRIGDVTATYSALQEPRRPIPAKITALTGITNDMVAGQKIDREQLDALLWRTDLIVAHNARFDRPFCENVSTEFGHIAWACSLSGVRWDQRGAEARSLSDLLRAAGYFHAANRALDDCFALLEILASEGNDPNDTPFAELYAAIQQPRVSIRALGARYDKNPELRKRGYRWCRGRSGQLGFWELDVLEEHCAVEVEYLEMEVCDRANAKVACTPVNPMERFRLE